MAYLPVGDIADRGQRTWDLRRIQSCSVGNE
jgi:hypothetical protein